jgi:lysozyme
MAKELLTIHEGRRSKVYKCPAGKQTIGVGRNLEDNGLRDNEIELMLDNDVNDGEAGLRELFGTDVFYSWSRARAAALIDMYVQLGYYRFRSFGNMIAAIKGGLWATASYEALDSKWARKDNPNRAATIAGMIRKGEV